MDPEHLPGGKAGPGKRDDARAAYVIALAKLDPKSPYKNYVQVKLDSLGGAPAAAASGSAAGIALPAPAPAPAPAPGPAPASAAPTTPAAPAKQ